MSTKSPLRHQVRYWRRVYLQARTAAEAAEAAFNLRSIRYTLRHAQ